MKGVRGGLAAALGLALLQLVLSTSQKGGQSATLISAGFGYPARWVRALTDADVPAIPNLAQQGISTSLTSTTPSNGLSGTGTPAGTGSTLINI